MMNRYNLGTPLSLSTTRAWRNAAAATALVALLAIGMHLSADWAGAQVAVSLGVQEVYDDNIFLEDDKAPVLPTLPPGTPPIVLGERSDGDPNDDMITNVTLGVNTPLNVSRYFTGGFDGKLGGFFFADQSDENRITVDTLLNIDAADIVIPGPYYLSASSALSSNSNDITVAEGSAARQTESHEATISTGVRGVDLAPSTEAGMGYKLVRHDFLGDWTIGGSDSDDPVIVEDGEIVVNGNSDEDGADFFINGIDGGISYHATQHLDLTLSGTANYYSFTDVENNDPRIESASDLDRLDADLSVGFRYIASEKLSFGAYVGPEYTRYSNEPEPVQVTVVDPDGTVRTVLSNDSRSEESLGYGANLDYMITSDTLVNALVQQSLGTDISGERIESRSAAVNFSQNIGERIDFLASGLFTQYSSGESLSDSTDRWEATASLRYALTQSLAVSLGYNYITQSAGDNEDSLIRSEDYEGNRVFIGLSTGVVGVKS